MFPELCLNPSNRVTHNPQSGVTKKFGAGRRAGGQLQRIQLFLSVTPLPGNLFPSISYHPFRGWEVEVKSIIPTPSEATSLEIYPVLFLLYPNFSRVADHLKTQPPSRTHYASGTSILIHLTPLKPLNSPALRSNHGIHRRHGTND